MPAITLEQAEAQLEVWLAASSAVASNQEYEIDTGSAGRRRLKRADAAEIRQQITFWENKVTQLSGSSVGRRSTRIVFE